MRVMRFLQNMCVVFLSALISWGDPERRGRSPGKRRQLMGWSATCANLSRTVVVKENMNIHAAGIDIGKYVFHFVGLDESGAVVIKKRFSRTQLLTFTANLAVGVIGMEACSGAHFLARALEGQGHQVRLMPAQYVRPFVKSNKNDYIDAEAIAEAVQRPTMRFVPIKTDDQLDLQALHRTRERWIARRTALINQMRAFLLERGLAVRQGVECFRGYLPTLFGDAEGKLSGCMRTVLLELWHEWEDLEGRITRADEAMARIAADSEACQRLQSVPGIGTVTATALIAAIGNGAAFRKGRDLAAWLGLVPKQFSTGGKPRLLGISKRGNSYLRQLFVHGARAVFSRCKRNRHRFGPWLNQLELRKKRSTSIVALANKLARIAWAVLTKEQTYQVALDT
jgi:transposase